LRSEELKLQIVQVARKHFALHGFQGTSLKEVAAEAQVAGSLINYHFRDKEGLFHSCISNFARDRVAAIRRIVGEVRNREEVRVRLELFVEEMLASMVADPYGFDIIQREVRSGNPAVIELFQETLMVAFDGVVDFFKSCQQLGLLRENLEPTMAAILLFSSTGDMARLDVLTKRFLNASLTDEAWRQRFSKHVVELFMNGVIK